MPDIALSTMSDDRLDYGIPVARLVNMYVEQVPEGESQSIRAPRPGLVNVATVGSGPIRGMHYAIGLGVFVASGEAVYLLTPTYTSTQLGTITGTNPVRFASTTGAVGAVTDGQFYYSNGTTWQHVTNFKNNSDGSAGAALPAFSDITYLGDRFILSVANDQTFYQTDLDNFTNIDPLQFEQADSSPDNIVGMARLGDDLFIGGGESVEWWSETGDANAPYTRGQGRNYQRGVAGQNTIAPLDNVLFFVGEDYVVYRSALIPQRVSTHGVEERLRASVLDPLNDWTAWTATFNGHPWYVLTVPDQGTFVYDVSTGQWSEWSSYNQTAFIGGFGLMRDGTILIGSTISPTIYTVSVGVNFDDGQPMERVVSAFIPPRSNQFRLNNVAIKTVSGFGQPTPTTNAVVEYRDSDDGGRTWSDWYARSLGFLGDTTVRPVWRGLGFVSSFGKAIEWRCTDDIRFVAQGASYNDARPD